MTTVTTRARHDDQRAGLEDFRRAVRSFLDRRAPESVVRAAMEAGPPYDADLWRAMAQQLGVAGLLVPEDLGGSGATQHSLAIVMHELGRSLVPNPVLSTVALGVNLLTAARGEYADGVLKRIATGEATVAVALADETGPWGSAGSVTFDGAGASVRLTGSKRHVVDAAAADVVVVLASGADGPLLAAVERETSGMSVEPVSTLDLTRSLAHVRLEAAAAHVIATGQPAVAAVELARQRAFVALAAECVGVAERSLERAVAHARNRIQFGRPIGSFQAVKHKCARMLVAQQLASALVDEAVDAAERPAADVALRASAAVAVAARAAYRVAADTIQVHGGIGFTWEDASHLYFKRATANLHLFGEPRLHKRVVAAQLGLIEEVGGE